MRIRVIHQRIHIPRDRELKESSYIQKIVYGNTGWLYFDHGVFGRELQVRAHAHRGHELLV